MAISISRTGMRRLRCAVILSKAKNLSRLVMIRHITSEGWFVTGRELERLERLTALLERMRLEEYLEYLGDARRVARRNLLIGVCRGLGYAVGFSVLGAMLIVLLRGLVADNIPLIGGFLAEVIRAIEARM